MSEKRGGRLAGKTAFITGAASGLGKAMAEMFVREGAWVAIADIDAAGGKRVAGALGDAATFLALDVTREEAWIEALAAAVGAFGSLDILVNNAGVAMVGSVEKTSLEDWRRVQSVNLDGVFLGCKHGIPHLRAAGGGSIINVSSVAGLVGDPSLAAYCASKGGVRLLTKSVALHCARRKDGIRCNSLHPVFAETPMVESLFAGAPNPAAKRAALEAAVPLGRFAAPEEVAGMAVYLASDEARFITGGEFVVDGGLTAG
jgi:NAD(P)-dependent dehydrogenase (short-subunit alcohol dehydrogenase family)